MASHDEEADCYVKPLPTSLIESAAKLAARIYPANAPVYLSKTAAAAWDAPQDLAVITLKYWGPGARALTVSFLENPEDELRSKILKYMNAWNCSIRFKEAPRGQAGTVRISLAGKGYWSYLGTDILHIPVNQPTMNLQDFSLETDESEYRRVVCHETGHTLGFPHEQLRKEIVNRIDPTKAYAWFKRMYGWDRDLVDRNVLTPIDDGQLTASPTDSTSIMAYHLPKAIMKYGPAVEGGNTINEADQEFCLTLYPLGAAAATPMAADLTLPEAAQMSEDKWSQETNMPVRPNTCAFAGRDGPSAMPVSK